MGCANAKPAAGGKPENVDQKKEEEIPAPSPEANAEERDQKKEVEIPAPSPEASAEEQAIYHLKVLFHSMDLNADSQVDRTEFQKALKKNEKIGALLAEANFKSDATALEQLDTNKDDHISWPEFEKHLKATAKTQVVETGKVEAAEEAVGERAEKRLKKVFKMDTSYKHEEGAEEDDMSKDTVIKDALAPILKSEPHDFIDLLKQVGLRTDWDVVVDLLDADQSGRVTWDDLYTKLKETPLQPVIEGQEAAKSTCC